MMDAIERTLELEASPRRVWKALTEANEIASWFGDSAELDPKLGSEGWFGWESFGRAAVRIEVFEPETRLVWRWAPRSRRRSSRRSRYLALSSGGGRGRRKSAWQRPP